MPVDRSLTLEDFDRMTPDARADAIRAGVVDFDKLPVELRESIQAWAVEVLRPRSSAA